MKKGFRTISALAVLVLLAVQVNARTIEHKIVLSSYETSVAYADLKVVDENGNIIFQDNFSGKNKKNWKGDWKFESKYWKYQDGWFVQTDTLYSTHMMICQVPVQTNNFDIYVKAKKLGGKEGFIIGYGGPRKVNIGGWGNTKHSLMYSFSGANMLDSEGSINTGQEYIIHISVRGYNTICYLDDKLIVLQTEDAQETVDFILKHSTVNENSLLHCSYLTDRTEWYFGRYRLSEEFKKMIGCLKDNGYHVLGLAYKNLKDNKDNSWKDSFAQSGGIPTRVALGFLKNSELNKVYKIVKNPAVDYAALTQTGGGYLTDGKTAVWCDSVKWSGEIRNGKIHGKGVGFAVVDDPKGGAARAYYVETEYREGIPVGNLTYLATNSSDFVIIDEHKKQEQKNTENIPWYLYAFHNDSIKIHTESEFENHIIENDFKGYVAKLGKSEGFTEARLHQMEKKYALRYGPEWLKKNVGQFFPPRATENENTNWDEVWAKMYVDSCRTLLKNLTPEKWEKIETWLKLDSVEMGSPDYPHLSRNIGHWEQDEQFLIFTKHQEGDLFKMWPEMKNYDSIFVNLKKNLTGKLLEDALQWRTCFDIFSMATIFGRDNIGVGEYSIEERFIAIGHIKSDWSDGENAATTLAAKYPELKPVLQKVGAFIKRRRDVYYKDEDKNIEHWDKERSLAYKRSQAIAGSYSSSSSSSSASSDSSSSSDTRSSGSSVNAESVSIPSWEWDTPNWYPSGCKSCALSNSYGENQSRDIKFSDATTGKITRVYGRGEDNGYWSGWKDKRYRTFNDAVAAEYVGQKYGKTREKGRW